MPGSPYLARWFFSLYQISDSLVLWTTSYTIVRGMPYLARRFFILYHISDSSTVVRCQRLLGLGANIQRDGSSFCTKFLSWILRSVVRYYCAWEPVSSKMVFRLASGLWSRFSSKSCYDSGQCWASLVAVLIQFVHFCFVIPLLFPCGNISSVCLLT